MYEMPTGPPTGPSPLLLFPGSLQQPQCSLVLLLAEHFSPVVSLETSFFNGHAIFGSFCALGLGGGFCTAPPPQDLKSSFLSSCFISPTHIQVACLHTLLPGPFLGAVTVLVKGSKCWAVTSLNESGGAGGRRDLHHQ